MSLETALAKLANKTIKLSFEETSNKNYQKLQSYLNVTSYSMLDVLHQCPRKFQLIKARAAAGGAGANNVDFAFGHAVGAGIQAWLSSNHDMDAAIFNAILAWRIPYEAEIPLKNKSIWNACLAVQKYAEFWEENLSEWDIWILPNGKPAIELSIEVDFENGYKHYMHIDVILEHKLTKKLAVQENKTLGFKDVEEALYANSDQALSYAVLIDMLRLDTNYQVLYTVYTCPTREWHLLPFTKSNSLKAEWLTDVRLDHATLSTYKQVNFYPKRGASCFAYMRRCEFFGSCNLTNNLAEPTILGPEEHAERVDYSFKLSAILERQHHRNETQPVIAEQGANFENID
jgi:hypothetical protein